jgi:peptidoglycan/LPS O-acetylase OafA/YrhL
VTAHAAQIGYRPDIDGLRAVAVTGVVIFHAHVFGLSGGFVGVDVFFVISGFLITRILLEEHAREGRISLVAFYERRVRRLLPAFYAMLAATGIAVAFLYAPVAFENFATSALAALFFASNFYFWQTAGYFSEEAEIAPLLHTWSLAVEEQFYLMWPLVLIVALSRQTLRALLLPAMVAAGLVSLALAEFGGRNLPPAAFYLMPTRAFELLIGALLALPALPAVRSRTLADALSLAGLGAILTAYVVIDADTPFPGLWALLPCGGAALVLYAGHRSGVANAILAWRPVVFVGLVSYSWYLWHWPAFAIWRYVTFRPPTALEAVALMAFSFLCAVVSWRYVERPFRKPPVIAPAAAADPSPTRRILRPRASGWRTIGRLGLVPGLAFAALALGVRLADGLPARLDPHVAQLSRSVDSVSPLRAGCHLAPRDGFALPPAENCTDGADVAPTAILWGDSHAEHYASTLAALGREAGFAFRHMSKSACPPLANAGFVDEPPIYRGNCEAFNDEVLSLIEADPTITDVWLASFWPFNLGAIGRDPAALAGRLAETVARIEAMGRRVHVFGVIPVFPFEAGGCVVRQARFPSSEIDCSLDPGEVEAVRELDAVLAAAAGSAYIPMLPLICPKGAACTPLVGGTAAFADHHHLTADFATSSPPTSGTSRPARRSPPAAPPRTEWNSPTVHPSGSAASVANDTNSG